jgi:hypothetical protein
MKYPEDSFYPNFAGAYMSKDTQLTKDLIFSEIAKIIATKRKKVVAALKEIGIKFSKSPTDKEIVDAIINNIGEDRRVDIAVSYLIAEENKKHEEKFSNAGGFWEWAKGLVGAASDESTDTDKTKADTTAAGGSTVGAIADTIGIIFGFAQSVKEGQSQREADKAALMQQLIALKTAKTSGSGNNTLIYVVLGLVVVGGLVGMYFYMKKSGAKAELGGDIKVIK